MKNNLRYLIAYSFLSLLLLIFSGTKTNAGVNKIILVKIETESQKQLLESLSMPLMDSFGLGEQIVVIDERDISTLSNQGIYSSVLSDNIQADLSAERNRILNSPIVPADAPIFFSLSYFAWSRSRINTRPRIRFLR